MNHWLRGNNLISIKVIRIWLSIWILLGAVLQALGQPANVELDTYMKKLRTYENQGILFTAIVTNRNAAKFFRSLELYFSDTLVHVRKGAFEIARQVGLKSADKSVRTLAITALVTQLDDSENAMQDAGVLGLCKFEKPLFSNVHKSTIIHYFNSKTDPSNTLIKLVAFLELDKLTPRLRDIARSSPNIFQKWNARIALARLGDPEAIRYLQRKLADAPISDDFVYDIVPDLVYTHQPEVFRFLAQLIQSKEKRCYSANPDSNKKTECAFRIIEAIAPAIENFPYPVSMSGDLEVDDDEKALEEIRAWFKSNPGYKINMNSF